MQNNNLVLFDFCETLIKFQTADRYIKFCRNHLHSKRLFLWHYLTCALLKVRFFQGIKIIKKHNNLQKRLVLWQLKGLDRTTCEDLAKKYFEEMLLPNTISETIRLLKKHQEQGDCIWIISGGYDLYIRYFVEHFNIDGFISSKIGFNSNKCSGKIEGLDCMSDNKILLLEHQFGQALQDKNIYFYTDSSSDLPLLQYVNHPYIISKHSHQQWIDKFKFKEIIWT